MKCKKETLHLDTHPRRDLRMVPQYSGENLTAFIPLILAIMPLCAHKCWKKWKTKIERGPWWEAIKVKQSWTQNQKFLTKGKEQACPPSIYVAWAFVNYISIDILLNKLCSVFLSWNFRLMQFRTGYLQMHHSGILTILNQRSLRNSWWEKDTLPCFVLSPWKQEIDYPGEGDPPGGRQKASLLPEAGNSELRRLCKQALLPLH